MLLKKKILGVIAAIAAIGSMAIVASAIPSKPYSSYNVYIEPSDNSKATAIITKCSCNPVNNYLAARVKMQYQLNGNYYNTPWSTWDEGSNKAQAGMTWGTSAGIANYAEGEFRASCSGGDILPYSKTT